MTCGQAFKFHVAAYGTRDGIYQDIYHCIRRHSKVIPQKPKYSRHALKPESAALASSVASASLM